MANTKDFLDVVSNKRKSARTDLFSVLAKISKDGEHWSDIEIVDISTGGVLFKAASAFEEGDHVWFDLLIKPIMFITHTTLNIKTQGEVLDSRPARENSTVYGAKFSRLPSRDETELGMLIQMIYEKYGRSVSDH